MKVAFAELLVPVLRCNSNEAEPPSHRVVRLMTESSMPMDRAASALKYRTGCTVTEVWSLGSGVSAGSMVIWVCFTLCA